MHRLAASVGGWSPQVNGVIFISQTPAPLVFLTAADTDIQTLAATVSQLPAGFPAFRVANLLQLQQQLSIDTYAEEVLQSARVIVLRLLGGRSYWSYGLEVLREIAQTNGCCLIVLPGDDRPDPDLISHSNISLKSVNQIWRYFTEGGVENFANALLFVADICLGTSYNPPAPAFVPKSGVYAWQSADFCADVAVAKVGILFYRAHYLAGNLAPIDAICQALFERHLWPVPVFVSSPRDPEIQGDLLAYFQPPNQSAIQVLINTTSFAISQVPTAKNQSDSYFFRVHSSFLSLDVPVLQAILSSGSFEGWDGGLSGLSPRDMAMNVALPEVDGRIITRAISFKSVLRRHPLLETEVVVYEPVRDRVDFVANLAANWVRLRASLPQNRRVALILSNYPTKDGRLANGVGLDTPASCVEILKALSAAGYCLDDFPSSGDELISLLVSGVTNDVEGRDFRAVRQGVNFDEYWRYFQGLPVWVREAVGARWGFFDGKGEDVKNAKFEGDIFAVSGVQFGNVFVGVQPSRGYEVDPSLNYHAPDLEPTHDYLAFYYWVRFCFGADAVVHVGKHGNLEWLPGKSVALSECCYPEVALGALPHFYPFIVNDPGEGSQAKRRSGAVILDHLTPPMTRAELYGSLVELEGLLDEYYDAECLDPSRLPLIQAKINKLVLQESLYLDLGLDKEEINNPKSSAIQSRLDSYLCDLKEAQIRDGLHVFGVCPSNRQLRDLIVSIARYPGVGRLGLIRSLARDLGVDFDPLTTDFSLVLSEADFGVLSGFLGENKLPRNVGDVIELLEQQAAVLVENVLRDEMVDFVKVAEVDGWDFAKVYTQKELDWIRDYLLPALLQTPDEITNLLRGLDGFYVPSGPSGAPTRGRPEVLPTGRNFYSVDIRGLPTETAWDIGRKAAEVLIERYTQEHGEYPKTLGLSVWGTSTMRTGGDDIAEALALLGVRPVWDGPGRRVVDFEVLPVSVLGRPRVDCTLRISGFFRDAFPNLIDLFDQAVVAVASLDEPPDINPLAAKVEEETRFWQAEGLRFEQARQRSLYRIFGSKPGAYGAGLQGLIESQNWSDDEDLARAYINWSSYAYSASSRGFEDKESAAFSGLNGVTASEAFELRLRSMQIVLHNQDNREHDLLDSDDYYQFQGGLTAAVRVVSGKNPDTYFGDNSRGENPKVRRLKEEIARVYRSRVVNPKWIAGVMRHGYKGAFEMSATLDYLFAYDATARCVEDFMYDGVAKAFLFDEVVRGFIEEKNPWVLRDMAERLLEANQRGLWQSAGEDMIENLRCLVLQAEGVIEAGMGCDDDKMKDVKG